MKTSYMPIANHYHFQIIHYSNFSSAYCITSIFYQIEDILKNWFPFNCNWFELENIKLVDIWYRKRSKRISKKLILLPIWDVWTKCYYYSSFFSILQINKSHSSCLNSIFLLFFVSIRLIICIRWQPPMHNCQNYFGILVTKRPFCCIVL